MLGTWRLVGRDVASGQPITGTVTRRWLPGGFLLVQTTETDGHPEAGVEYIGDDSAADLPSVMLFSDEGPGPFCAFPLEYVWDVTGDERRRRQSDRARRRHRAVEVRGRAPQRRHMAGGGRRATTRVLERGAGR